MTYHIIRRTKGQYAPIFRIGIASIIEGLIEVLSFGRLTSDIRAWVLFEYEDD
jgi:hypothetical protein